MADPEHLKILEQGVEVWNEWRVDNPAFRPDLIKANLSNVDLIGAHLSGADLYNANLGGANLSNADLMGADLTIANLTMASLAGANLTGAFFLETVFGDTNLESAIGLDACNHLGPSIIDHRTLQKSWPLPEVFLRGCGLPDRLIEYLPSLMDDPIQFYSCFISYSSKDDEFAKRLYADLQAEGVRCWFALEDMKIGDKFRARIDDAIRVHEKLLLVLSEDAIASDWVEKEVETAFEKERKTKKIALFPVRLDETVMDSGTAWAADIRRTRHIGDFRNWKDHQAYQKAFKRLLRDLKAQKK